jgi:hypothetical protein
VTEKQRSLSDRSLIHLDIEAPQPGQEQRRWVSLHDLLHDLATKLAGDLRYLHRQLLDSYRKLCPNRWGSGPNDGYSLESSGHLSRGGLWTELRQLLVIDAMGFLQPWTTNGAHRQGIECLKGLLEDKPAHWHRIEHARREQSSTRMPASVTTPSSPQRQAGERRSRELLHPRRHRDHFEEQHRAARNGHLSNRRCQIATL